MDVGGWTYVLQCLGSVWAAGCWGEVHPVGSQAPKTSTCRVQG